MDGPVLVLLGILLLVAGVVFVVHWEAKKRREALNAWAGKRGLAFDRSRDRSIVHSFPQFACLKKGDANWYAFNRVGGTTDGRTILAFDYHYETIEKTSDKKTTSVSHYFSAVICSSPIALKELYIRPETFMDKVGAFFGSEDINFESAEFSSRFHVSAPDRRWAYDVLHVRAMEELLKYPPFFIALCGGHAIAWRETQFKTDEFDEALATLESLLNQLPGYVKHEQASKAS